MTNEELLTTGKIADELGVHRTTVMYWTKTGKLEAAQTVNGIRLYRRSDVETLAADRAEATS